MVRMTHALRKTYIGTRYMSRYKYTACLDRNSVQWKPRTAIQRTVFKILWRYLCMSDMKQSKYTTWAVNLKRVVRLCSVVKHTNPVLTRHTQRRTEYTLSPRWQRSADGCLPDVYNMPDAFTQELRWEKFLSRTPASFSGGWRSMINVTTTYAC